MAFAERGELPSVKDVLMMPAVLFMMTGPQGILVGVAVAAVLAVPVLIGAGLAAAAPLVFLVFYALVGRGLRFAVNDAPGCVGEVGPSALRAAVFASAFTVPIALLLGVGFATRSLWGG